MFCKHTWKKIDEEITKSKFQHTMEIANKYMERPIRVPHQMCNASRKVIKIFTCEKCGKIKKFVTNI